MHNKFQSSCTEDKITSYFNTFQKQFLKANINNSTIGISGGKGKRHIIYRRGAKRWFKILVVKSS